MKKDYIFKGLLILTAISVTIGVVGRLVVAGQSNNKEKEINTKQVKVNDIEVKDNKAYNLKEEDKDKQIVTKSGFVRDYYEKDGELYIVFDEVEFFRGEQAKKEYLKDGNTEESEEEWGNDYYIRNNDNSTKVYKVSKDSKLQILSFEVEKGNGIDLVPVSIDKIKEKIDKYKGVDYLERGLLFDVDENDGVVYGMRAIYTP